MRFDVLTLFPEIFPGYLGQSLLCRAIDAGLVQVQLHNLRDWATGPHSAVDDRPFGGGPGMVLKAEPVVEAVEAVQAAQATPRMAMPTRPSLASLPAFFAAAATPCFRSQSKARSMSPLTPSAVSAFLHSPIGAPDDSRSDLISARSTCFFYMCVRVSVALWECSTALVASTFFA